MGLHPLNIMRYAILGDIWVGGACGLSGCSAYSHTSCQSHNHYSTRLLVTYLDASYCGIFVPHSCQLHNHESVILMMHYTAPEQVGDMIEGYVSSLVAGQVQALLGRCGLGEVVERLQFYQVGVAGLWGHHEICVSTHAS